MKASQCTACQGDAVSKGDRHGPAFCVYCQRTLASVGNLHRHIERAHPDTIRRQACLEAEPYEFEEPLRG